MKKNRTVIAICCIILAFVVCFGLSPLVNRATEAKTEIVRLVRAIPQGHKLEPGDLETVKVGAYHLPADIIKTKEQAVGKYAACDMVSSDYLLPTKLTTQADSANDVFKTLTGQQQAMSVTIKNFAAGLSGKLRNGDIISFINNGKNGDATIPAELKYVRVVTATTATGYDSDQTQNTKDGEKSELPTTITVLVNSAQAKLLAKMEGENTIHIALVYRGGAEQANAFLQAQSEVFQ